jgi:hypothetical protein
VLVLAGTGQPMQRLGIEGQGTLLRMELSLASWRQSVALQVEGSLR